MQSLSSFVPTNGRPDNWRMDDIRANVRLLIGTKPDVQVATESGVGQSWLSRFMSGTIKSPSARKLEQLAGYLGVSVDALMGRDKTSTEHGRPGSQTARLDPGTLALVSGMLKHSMACRGDVLDIARVDHATLLMACCEDFLAQRAAGLSDLMMVGPLAARLAEWERGELNGVGSEKAGRVDADVAGEEGRTPSPPAANGD